MSNRIDVVQGDSLDLTIKTTDSRDLTDFTCRLQIRNAEDLTLELDRDVTNYVPADFAFKTLVTPAETGALDPSALYVISAQLSNVATSEALEIKSNLVIKTQVNFV